MNRLVLKITLFFCLTAFGVADVSAQEQKPGEYQVKALFLYNFINFVDWPADSSFYKSPTINFCIIGEDPFDGALDEIRDETVKGKTLTIKIYRSFEEPRGCHLLFIPASENNRTGQILRSIRETGVLTVADTEDSARQGAIIGFFMEHNKVRFAVNLDAARKARLIIRAKLLKLARIVKPAAD
jgi:hypothetical protein